jgi:hypothetical protein
MKVMTSLDIPPTEERVHAHTAAKVNERIRRDIECSLTYSARRTDCIDQRLLELEREWDVERVLELNASALAFSGVVLGVLGSRKWLALPMLVLAFLSQHAVQGWCPPIPLLRRLGVRTTREINLERYALKALRGDFEQIPAEEERDDEPRRAEAAMVGADPLDGKRGWSQACDRG